MGPQGTTANSSEWRTEGHSGKRLKTNMIESDDNDFRVNDSSLESSIWNPPTVYFPEDDIEVGLKTRQTYKIKMRAWKSR